MTIAMQFIFLAKVIPLAICLSLLFFLPGVSALADSTANEEKPALHTATIESADCVDFINENPARTRCGFIDLPIDHNDSASGTVTLPILIAGQTQSMSSAPSDKAILIPGGGGPGASIGFGPAYLKGEYLDYFQSLRAAGFDIVILDQRGAGFAKPALRCPETASAFKESVNAKSSFTESLTHYHESLNECRVKLADRNIPLTDFDTYQSARDFLAVMQLLPYDWWGTLATSYATVIVQAMEVIEPESFDRMVLDSPVAIDYQVPFTFELTESSVQRILSLCEITRRCNRRHRDIKNKFKQVLQQAKESPYSVTIRSDDSGVELLVDDITLLDILTLSAYSNYTIPEIPWVIDELYKERPASLKPLATDYWHFGSDVEFGTALSWAIHCKERQPLEAAYLRMHPPAPDSYSVNSKLIMEQELNICKDWNIQTTNTLIPRKLFTPKTLLIAGDLDPVISRDDIKNTADNFANRETIVLPGMGHSVWYQSRCTRQHLVEFFVQDSLSALKECKDGITRFK